MIAYTRMGLVRLVKMHVWHNEGLHLQLRKRHITASHTFENLNRSNSVFIIVSDEAKRQKLKQKVINNESQEFIP